MYYFQNVSCNIAFTTSVNVGTLLSYGRRLQTVLTVCQLLQLVCSQFKSIHLLKIHPYFIRLIMVIHLANSQLQWTKKSLHVMVDWALILHRWSKFVVLWGQQTFQIRVFYVTCCGPIQTKTRWDGERMIVALVLHSVPR